jgi:class 3 adenylate cyclase/tetratricopeptide (TPR) repeat protein
MGAVRRRPRSPISRSDRSSPSSPPGAPFTTSTGSQLLLSDRGSVPLLEVTAAISSRAGQRPLAILIDDLHAADSGSFELLSHLVFEMADALPSRRMPILLVCATRPIGSDHPLCRGLARITREEICERIELTGLGENEVYDLIEGMGLARPSHQLVGSVSAATGANPLFVQEVVRHLVREGAVVNKGGASTLHAPLTALRLPREITGTIDESATGLAPADQRVLTVAAFLGESFSLDELSAVTGEGEELLIDRLEEGIARGIVAGTRTAFHFSHPLMRHFFLSSPSAVRAQRIHLEIAVALERFFADRLDDRLLQVAEHWVAAGAAAGREQVLAWGRRAGDAALAMFAPAEALRFYEAALAALGSDQAKVAERAELHHLAGVAHYRNMDVGPCLDHYDEAIAAYRIAADLPGVTRALLRKLRAHLTQACVPYGTLAEEVEPLERALDLLGEAEPALRDAATATLAEAYFTARRPARARELAQSALARADERRDPALRAHAHFALGLARFQTMELREALASFEDSLFHARSAGDLWLQGWPANRIPMALVWLGRLDDADKAVESARSLIDRTHDWADYSLTIGTMTSIAAVRGDFAATARHAHAAVTMARRSGYPWGGLLALQSLACARALQGHFAEARDAIDAIVAPGYVVAEPGPSVQLLAWLYRELLAASAGEARSASDELASLPLEDDEWRDVNTLGAICAVIETADAPGSPGVAEAPVAALAAAVERGIVLSPGWPFLLRRVLGVAATMNRRWDEAEEHFRAAVDDAVRIGARPELGRSRLDHARMLAARGEGDDRERAAGLLRDASALFAALGMRPFEERAGVLAGELRGALPGRRRVPSAARRGLSELEVEILQRIARGRTDAEIAADLLLSQGTVTGHVRTIYAQLGVDSRVAAAAAAYESGLGVGQSPRSPARSRPGAVEVAREPADLPAILYTDMQGSTALLDSLGEDSARLLLRSHNQLLREALRYHQGFEVKHTGDGLVASFPSSEAALRCAVAIQEGLERHNRDRTDAPIRVRIGVNCGTLETEGGELFGATVIVAARICARAAPG